MAGDEENETGRAVAPDESGPAVAAPDEVLSADAVAEAEADQTESVRQPAKVLRIGSMVKTLLDEYGPPPWTRRAGCACARSRAVDRGPVRGAVA